MPKHTNKLNEAQKEAVNYTEGPLLIVAGAGTGKTTVITEKIAHLVNSGLAKPEEVLALTFTDRAAEEMQERVDETLDAGYVDLHISTFHAFCQRLLETYGIDVGIPDMFKLVKPTDAWLLVKENINSFDLDYYKPIANPTRHIHALIDYFSKCKDELISPEKYIEYAKTEKDEEERGRLLEIGNAYKKYNKLLLDNNCLDFGDLIYYSVELLQKRKKVADIIQERFKFILIDEFQDVNWAQYVLIQKIAEKSQLTAVGDDDQSIYAFRGSNVSVILRFKEDFPKAREIVLNKNYRSGQKILDIAYKSIQNNNPDRLETKLNIDKKLLSSSNSTKGNAIHLHYDSLEGEVRGVVEEIAKINKENKDITWNDFAILVRANSHVEPFVQALEQAKIPYEYLASSGLYRQPIVMDCFNFLKLLDNHRESTSIFRLLKLPFINFSEYDLQQITSMARKKSISYYSALKKATEFGLSNDGIKICNNLLALIKDGSNKSRFEKPTAVLYTFLENSGYLKYLTDGESRGNSKAIHSIYHIKQFFDFMGHYEQSTAEASVAHFVEYYASVLESGDKGVINQPADTPDSVNILTVHGSKGLEYKYVFLVNMVEERFPTRRKGVAIEVPLDLINEKPPEGDSHYQEERRLFYVGLTRAKERVHLSSADNYGGVRKKKLSRFLDELDFTNESKSSVKVDSSSLGGIVKGKKGKEISEFVFKTPNKFSFSQIKMYDICPYKYKLSTVLKIPIRGSHYFSFGTSIHGTLETFYKEIKELNGLKQDSLFGLPTEVSVDSNIKVPSKEDLIGMYKKSWIEDWYKDKNQRESYYNNGIKLLRKFYESNDGKWTIPVSIEGYFKINIGKYIINGRMDRIDKLDDNTLEIIDYKTGKGKEKLSAGDKEQLLIYQIASQSLPEYRNLGETGKLSFYYLEDDLKVSFIGKDKELEKLEEKIVSTIEKIVSGNFTPKPNKIMCGHCDFRDICQYRA